MKTHTASYSSRPYQFEWHTCVSIFVLPYLTNPHSHSGKLDNILHTIYLKTNTRLWDIGSLYLFTDTYKAHSTEWLKKDSAGKDSL